jgi:hypothetical protein
MARRVTNLFIGAEAGEGRRSGEEMADISGVFKAFNVVSFTKRNGGGGTSYWRGRGRLKQHFISL